LKQLPGNHFRIKVFASDIDKSAVNQARRGGGYSAKHCEDITPSRLALHFNFNEKTNTYQIHEKIRKILIFSENNDIVRLRVKSS
jgi:two-component system CheB/CheR fusion protein